MANNYLQFSEVLKLKNATQVKWAYAYLTKPARDESDEHGLGFDWSIDEKRELWLRDDGEYGDVDAVASFVQAYLVKFDPQGIFTLSWAETCSSPRAGEFGGGAFCVTAKKQEWINTLDWVCKHHARKPAPKKKRKK
jgi:hypothetical protein